MDNIKKGKELVDKIAQNLTLKLFRVGCDEKNFIVLNKLPLKASEVEKELGLTPMPTNRRIQELRDAKLVFREKSGKEIELTDLGKDFVKHIGEIKAEVIQNMANLI